MPLRGYNESGKPDGIDAYHMETLVADIKCLVQELGVEKFTLVRFIVDPKSKNPGNEVPFSTPFTISRSVLFQALNIVLKVAHDWGGGVAWSFAALHPELLSNLVTILC